MTATSSTRRLLSAGDSDALRAILIATCSIMMVGVNIIMMAMVVDVAMAHGSVCARREQRGRVAWPGCPPTHRFPCRLVCRAVHHAVGALADLVACRQSGQKAGQRDRNDERMHRRCRP